MNLNSSDVMIEHENRGSPKFNMCCFCSSVPGHETSVTPGGVDMNYAGPSTHGPAPAPSSTGGGGLACLNEQEQARIRELYDASRSLDEPMEKEVGWRSFLTSFSLPQPRFSSTYIRVERCAAPNLGASMSNITFLTPITPMSTHKC